MIFLPVWNASSIGWTTADTEASFIGMVIVRVARAAASTNPAMLTASGIVKSTVSGDVSGAPDLVNTNVASEMPSVMIGGLAETLTRGAALANTPNKAGTKSPHNNSAF